MTADFEKIESPEDKRAADNVAALAELFPDAVVDGEIDFDVLSDLLGGEEKERTGAETFGLRWPGMAAARRRSTEPATGTLLPKPEESVGWDTTQNIVVEGDNLEVLRLLRRGYTSSVDVIYIDPPYNTGNDFVYDDTIKASHAEHEAYAGLRDEDGVLQQGGGSDRAAERKSGAASHSKWLSMMYPRLLVAHHLLKETGIIIVANDDTEHARLKLVLDRVFGAENFISNVVWQGGRKNDSHYVSVGHDYMTIYAKSERRLRIDDVKWREPKPGIGEALESARRIWDEHGNDHAAAQRVWRDWLREFKKTGVPTDSVTRYTTLDTDGRPIRVDGNISWPGRGGPRYDVLHPVTGKPVAVPKPGWRYPDPATMRREINEGRIYFGADHTTQPGGKTWLEDLDRQVATSFIRDRNAASVLVDGLFEGDSPFDHPKDVDVLKRWIGLAAGDTRDALFLDFFAGSGSTGQAVVELNAADGGNRRYILVQLDEKVEGKAGYETIADITRERLRRVGKQIAEQRTLDAQEVDTGFQSYRLASSNIKAWDGNAAAENPAQSILEAIHNLVEGRTTDDLLVEMMLRLGIDLITPVVKREVAGDTLYNLGFGTLYAYFGLDIDSAKAKKISEAIISWRDEEPVDSEITVVVRDTGFVNSEAKLNLAAALSQAGIATLRSI